MVLPLSLSGHFLPSPGAPPTYETSSTSPGENIDVTSVVTG